MPGKNAHHVVEDALGGKQVRLHVYQEPVHLDLVYSAKEADVIITNKPPPKTRSECLAGTRYTGSYDERLAGKRFCGHIARCKFHLWHLEGTQRAGRRHKGKAPPSTVRPMTLASCALDTIDQRRGAPMSSRAVGRVLGLHRRDVEYVVKAALAKLRAAGVEIENAAPRGPHPLE